MVTMVTMVTVLTYGDGKSVGVGNTHTGDAC